MNSDSQPNALPTALGKYIDLYREHCGTTLILSNQECAVIERFAEWARSHGPEGVAPHLLLGQVRRDWYRFTDYSQLKADIDYYLDESVATEGRS